MGAAKFFLKAMIGVMTGLAHKQLRVQEVTFLLGRVGWHCFVISRRFLFIPRGKVKFGLMEVHHCLPIFKEIFKSFFFPLSEGISYKAKTFIFQRALSFFFFFFLCIFMYRCRMRPKKQRKSYEFMVKRAQPMDHNRYEV